MIGSVLVFLVSLFCLVVLCVVFFFYFYGCSWFSVCLRFLCFLVCSALFVFFVGRFPWCLLLFGVISFLGFLVLLVSLVVCWFSALSVQ